MASVCGGCLALQDVGVPIKCSIAGIAMGMVLDTKEFRGDGTPRILSDITRFEDASGDMDFKIAGNEDGITAFQMDIKVGEITLPIMTKALTGFCVLNENLNQNTRLGVAQEELQEISRRNHIKFDQMYVCGTPGFGKQANAKKGSSFKFQSYVEDNTFPLSPYHMKLLEYVIVF